MLTAPFRQRGIGLIELLVAIVVATFGLLALAALQAAGTRYAKMTQYRALATLLATDLTERLRANRSSAVATAANYTYQVKFADQAPTPVLPAGAPTCDTATSACDEAQIAALDLYQWRRSARQHLPEGSVFLLPDTAPGTALSLWLAWRDPAVQSATTGDEQGSAECPAGLEVSTDKAVRCQFFRIEP